MGFSIDLVNRIMGCVTSTSFVVLINGSPSSFFRPTIGLQQVCPLSPFLFLLVEEYLSKLIHQSKREGLKGVSVSDSMELTRILFLDDVLMMGTGTLENMNSK